MNNTQSALRDHRRERDLTQQELGSIIGVTGQCVSMIEGGRSAGNWRTRKRIARALDVPESALFDAA